MTVLFCDVVEPMALSDRLDPESRPALLDRYVARMKEIAECHGGSVEKLTGGAVVAG